MKTLFYIIVYGFLGYGLERVINLIFLGQWHDNSVLFLPIQPMYGLGVVLTLLFYEAFIKKLEFKKTTKGFILVPFAGIFTMISEFTSGFFYEQLFGTLLWDYRDTFPTCRLPYICIIPTPIFGIIAVLTVLYVHPFIDSFVKLLPKWLIYATIAIVLIDYMTTYFEVLI